MRVLAAIVLAALFILGMDCFEDEGMPRRRLVAPTSSEPDPDAPLFPDDPFAPKSPRSSYLKTMKRLCDARSFLSLLHFQIVELHPSLEGVKPHEFDARALA